MHIESQRFDFESQTNTKYSYKVCLKLSSYDIIMNIESQRFDFESQTVKLCILVS